MLNTIFIQVTSPVNSNTGIYNSRTTHPLGTIIKRRLPNRRLPILTDDKAEQYSVKTGASDAAVGKLASVRSDGAGSVSARVKKRDKTISRTGIVYIQLERHQTKPTEPILTRDHGDANETATERTRL